MGQTSSGDKVTPEWAEVQRQAFNLKELALLTYESFTETLQQLNQISKTVADRNGKKLNFTVKSGTDTTVLWKATVKIGCIRIDKMTGKVASCRLLNLKQYMQVYRMIMSQVAIENSLTDGSSSHSGCQQVQEDSVDDEEDEKQCSAACRVLKPNLKQIANSPLTTSMILEKVSTEAGQTTPLEECCICMERKPELILPCAHSYCVPCIEQWNVSSKTCPVCRETLESTDDSWVISEAPDSVEVAKELQKLLNGLAK
ncbi:hypothetical protein CHUAL_000130 [Chamberlinius hualienensis]